jgi:threonine/homoserine/homoserine lactone efflux protein
MLPDGHSLLFFLSATMVLLVIPGRGSVAVQVLFLGLLFTLLGVLSDNVWAVFAGTISNSLMGNSRWFDRQRYLSGGLLITLGLATAFSGSGKNK